VAGRVPNPLPATIKPLIPYQGFLYFTCFNINSLLYFNKYIFQHNIKISCQMQIEMVLADARAHDWMLNDRDPRGGVKLCAQNL